MSKRAGAISADTKQAIIQAAEAEFVGRGFQGASLRRICAAAGVTTGAIYCFFSGKEQLFETIISGVTEPILKLIQEHYASEGELPKSASEVSQDNDIAMSALLIDFYFQNRPSFDLLLRHMNRPAVQKFMDDLADCSTEHYSHLLDLAARAAPRRRAVDKFAVHQFVHMQIDAMLTLISHDFGRDEMQANAKIVVKMLRGAFRALLSD